MAAGVLNKEQMQGLMANQPRIIKSESAISVAPERSSIDLPLGSRYFEMEASCRPHRDLSVSDLLQEQGVESKRLESGTVFKRTKVYLVPIEWNLELPEELCVRSTAKSSIGRLDALVRLVTDKQHEFDRIRPGMSTHLYIEVVPISFDLIVGPGTKLSQIRFIKGTEEYCTVPLEALKYEEDPVLVYSDGRPAELRGAEGDPAAVLLSLDLTDDPVLGFAGFRAKEDAPSPIDPSVRESGEEDSRYEATEFWIPERAHEDHKTIRIKSNSFYIFRSRERFKLPGHLAVECIAYSESLGDIRIHYAGFAHPYFGSQRDSGSPLIFEVRGHNMDTILRDGDALAKVYFRRMSCQAKLEGEDEYDKQELKLSGCFKPWPTKMN